MSSATIKAEAFTDCYTVAVTFDATKWFEQASDQDIRNLIACNWGGDYDADAVAVFMRDHDAGVARLFAYLDCDPADFFGEMIGFECYVDANDAIAWLTVNRPHLCTAVE